MDQMTPGLRRLRNVPLFAKLLAPFLVLILVIAAGGLYLVVHDLSSNAQTSLNGELLRRSLDARSRIHDRELYLLESATFAANLEGMAESVRAGDRASVVRLLRSVPALKGDVEVVTVLGADREPLAAFVRAEPGAPARKARALRWAAQGYVRRALASQTKQAGLPELDGVPMLAIAAPVCAGDETCAPVGVAVVGMSLETLTTEAAGRTRRSDDADPAVAVYGAGGDLLAASNPGVARPTWRPVRGDALTRRTFEAGGTEVAVMFAPLEVQGRPVATLGVALPTAPAFSAARGAAFRLGFLLLIAIAGVVGIGALVSRWILGHLRQLVRTSRELGQGNLDARAPVVSRDELGELAEVLNGMADQLQASHRTLERRVEERTAEVRRLLRERNELFAGISHELRTPIAIILSEAKMLIDPAYAGKVQATGEAATTIISSGEQLLEHVNKILELARAESGRLDVSVADVRLDSLLREVRPTAEALAAANELEVEIGTASGLPPVRADRSRLKDVLVNLIENAAKYTAPGGSVSVSARRRNGAVRMSVSDTGIGIPAKAGDRIFEPFYQVPGVRPPRGDSSSGLGLALAKKLVEAQGGTIAYASRRGGGTEFVVELPVAETRS